MATVGLDTFSHSASITLAPHAGSTFAAAEERLVVAGGGFSTVLGFSIETTTAPGSGGVREDFEWRHSSGAEVEALGGRHSGWKLVRVSVPPPPSTTITRKKHGNDPGRSSDGKEVVAVWAAAVMSMSKILYFRFLGTGADGSLGDRWAVMAVASALSIWHRDRINSSRSTAGMGIASAVILN
jgi:hypothetical protein